MKSLILPLLLLILITPPTSSAQDTFSIVAVDSVTGEVGSAGASCVDLLLFFPNYQVDFLGDLLPGQGAINTQASYDATNQANARLRMLAGDTPQQIITWLRSNDVSNNSAIRQYGIVSMVNGSPQTAGHTGANTLNYKNHIAGPSYCIQGNILLGQSILDSMEARFLNEPGDLACKLMAALQGAKVVGADTRCASNGSSSLFAFLKVSQPSDPYGSPSLLVKVKTPGGAGIEPIDSLQTIFNAAHNCTSTSITEVNQEETVDVYPNPSKGSFWVELHNNNLVGGNYTLFDVQQRKIKSGSITAEKFSVDIEVPASGAYLLQLENGKTLIRKRVLLEK